MATSLLRMDSGRMGPIASTQTLMLLKSETTIDRSELRRADAGVE